MEGDLGDERVQFEVNHKAATRAGLYLSSRLLGVAKRVWYDEGPQRFR